MAVKRLWKLVPVVVLALLVGAVYFSVSYQPSQRVRIVDSTGKPVGQVWLGYHYQGRSFGLLGSLVSTRHGRILHSLAGELEIPAALHWHLPWNGRLRRVVDLVYVPALHAAAPPAAEEVRAGSLHVADRSGDPWAWSDSLERLYELVHFQLLATDSKVAARYRNPEGSGLRLAHALQGEVDAFRGRYGDRERSLPPEPEKPQQADRARRAAWRVAVERQQGAEATWGAYVDGLWKPRLAALNKRVAKLNGDVPGGAEGAAPEGAGSTAAAPAGGRTAGAAGKAPGAS